MAYTPYQDGTQAFGIPDSPLTINSITYIAEAIQITHSTQVVEIKDPNGIPTGQEIIPQVNVLTAKLQLATSATVFPSTTQTFTLEGATWILNEVGQAYQQAGYVYCNISARMKIN